MEKETKCMLAEQVGEVIIGGSLAVIIGKTVLPKCDNGFEKLVVSAGGAIGGWMLGREWAKKWLKFCDTAFDTDFEDVYEDL